MSHNEAVRARQSHRNVHNCCCNLPSESQRVAVKYKTLALPIRLHFNSSVRLYLRCACVKYPTVSAKRVESIQLEGNIIAVFDWLNNLTITNLIPNTNLKLEGNELVCMSSCKTNNLAQNLCCSNIFNLLK